MRGVPMEILTVAELKRVRRFAPRMKRAHVSVTNARSPGEMSKHFRGEVRRPDLVVVDSRLPDVGGGALLREIVAGAGETAVLIGDLERLSAEAVAGFARKHLESGSSAAPVPRALPTHASAELHDPESGRVDARRVASFFGLSLSAVAKLLGRSPQSVHRTPDAPGLQRPMSVLVRIATSLLALFGTPEKARLWLNAPHPDLDHVAPLELVKVKKAVVVAELLEDALLGHPG
ncbi:MAG: antitoxin Xre/MbcA/ParS toxin-binding domain-containing protein [Myxococcaceae bacterium]